MRAALPFDRQCQLAGLPMPSAEHRFHPVRRWRFDWAFRAQRLAVEVQGAVFTQGRHTRGAALEKEHEKLNAAASAGWRVCFVTPRQINNGAALSVVEAALSAGAVARSDGNG